MVARNILVRACPRMGIHAAQGRSPQVAPERRLQALLAVPLSCALRPQGRQRGFAPESAKQT